MPYSICYSLTLKCVLRYRLSLILGLNCKNFVLLKRHSRVGGNLCPENFLDFTLEIKT